MADTAGSISLDGIVKVVPSALRVGVGVTFINALILTQNTVVPSGTLKVYTSSADVQKDFTATSVEAKMAAVYFSGYEGAIKLPTKLYFYGASAGESSTASSPADLMNAIVNQTQDFSGFTTAWEPTLAEKQAFATWTGSQNLRFWYVAWDTDDQAIVSSGSTSFGTWLKTQQIDGTTAVYKDPNAAALCLGWMASLNFDAANGRTVLAQRRNGLVTPSVTDGTTAAALQGNGYSFYGAYANGLGRFEFLRDGAVSGQFLWADSYINQIWMNASMQSALLNLLNTTGQIPYTTQGDGLISAAVKDVVDQAISFGAIRPGVTLTSAQKLEIKEAAGADVADTIQYSGWYFQPNASSAPATVRVARRSPSSKFWYTDGQSVQSFLVASVEVQ